MSKTRQSVTSKSRLTIYGFLLKLGGISFISIEINLLLQKHFNTAVREGARYKIVMRMDGREKINTAELVLQINQKSDHSTNGWVSGIKQPNHQDTQLDNSI